MLRDHQELDKAVQQSRGSDSPGPRLCVRVSSTLPPHTPSRTSTGSAGDLRPGVQARADVGHQRKPEPRVRVRVRVGREYDKARSVFTQGLATPSKPQALRSLALLDLYLGKYRDAKAKLTEALLLNVSGKALLSEARNHLFMSILLEGEAIRPAFSGSWTRRPSAWRPCRRSRG